MTVAWKVYRPEHIGCGGLISWGATKVSVWEVLNKGDVAHTIFAKCTLCGMRGTQTFIANGGDFQLGDVFAWVDDSPD